MRILHDRVLLKKLGNEEVSNGGIVLAGAVDPSFEAEVLAVGTGLVTKSGVVVPLNVKVGDKVLYAQNAGQTVKVENETLLVVKEEDIYCIFD